MTFKQKHQQIIELAGGDILEDSYIIRPGIQIIMESKPTFKALEFFCLGRA